MISNILHFDTCHPDVNKNKIFIIVLRSLFFFATHTFATINTLLFFADITCKRTLIQGFLMSTLYLLTNSVFRNFLFYAVASVLKMMIMSLLTSRQRMKKKVNQHLFFIKINNNRFISLKGIC
jgi:hypothetical protein